MPLGEKNRAELRTEAVDQRCSVKKVFLEISKISHINTCARGSFSNKFEGLRPATLFKKSLWHRGFPENFVKFLRTNFSFRTPPVAASVRNKYSEVELVIIDEISMV